MKKTIMLLLMFVPFVSTLQAKKDPILDAIAESNLPKLRHLFRMSPFNEEHRKFYGAFAEEIARDYKEAASSIYNSKRDLLKARIAALGGLVGLGYLLHGITSYGREPYDFPEREMSDYEYRSHSSQAHAYNSATMKAPRNMAIGTLLLLGSSYWFKRSLACPHAQSRLLKAQNIVDYIKDFGKSETSSIDESASKEEAKPA